MSVVKDFLELFLHLDQHLVSIIHAFGPLVYLLFFSIVFAETGFVVTPFLPGDSLLFMVGAFAAAGSLNLPTLLISLIAAAVIGDSLNYAVGSFIGHKVFKKENSRIFKKEYLERTHKFYEKYGAKTIVIARFVPVVRTFAPFVAGAGKMSYGKFLTYNIVGGVLWVAGFVLSGFWFGNIPIIRDHFSIVTLLIVVLSILPIVIEYYKHRRNKIALSASAIAPVEPLGEVKK